MKLSKTAELASVFRAIRDEPELPDKMPDELFKICKEGDKDTLEEFLRVLVREVKNGITMRVIQYLNYGGRKMSDPSRTSHCMNCQRAFQRGQLAKIEIFCSNKCRTEYNNELKKEIYGEDVEIEHEDWGDRD